MDYTGHKDNIVNQLDENLELSTWCQDTFGFDFNIWVGFDERDPPDEDDCPLVVILLPSKTVGRGLPEKNYLIHVACFIHDASKKSHTSSRIKEYAGIDRCEEFRKKVETIVSDIDTGNAEIESIDIESDQIESFPFMVSEMSILYKEPFVFGSDPLL